MSGLTPEFVFNARITYQTASASSNTGKCKIATGGVTYITGSAMSQVSVSFTGVAAQNVAFDPAGRIAATNVQAAIEELDTDTALAVLSDVTGITGADRVTNIVSLTQAEYDALIPDTATLYVILG